MVFIGNDGWCCTGNSCFAAEAFELGLELENSLLRIFGTFAVRQGKTAIGARGRGGVSRMGGHCWEGLNDGSGCSCRHAGSGRWKEV